jgi:hypothetical protein
LSLIRSEDEYGRNYMQDKNERHPAQVIVSWDEWQELEKLREFQREVLNNKLSVRVYSYSETYSVPNIWPKGGVFEFIGSKSALAEINKRISILRDLGEKALEYDKLKLDRDLVQQKVNDIMGLSVRDFKRAQRFGMYVRKGAKV